jgi:ketosteroid isomerase-like protein
VDQFLGGAAGLMAPGTQVTIELVSAIADGDRVAAEWTSRATSRNGRLHHNRNVDIFTVRDGKVVSVREYTDTLHVAQALFPG